MSDKTVSNDNKQVESAKSEALSRSEIESLAGRSLKKRKSAPPSPSLNLEAPPRRQHVLGGNLSGVTHQPKSLSSKIIDISIVNWFVGVLVLAILGAFFWPQGERSVSEVTNPVSNQISGDQNTSELNDELNEENGFSRENDINRANEFRLQDEQEAQVKKLLGEANSFIQKRQFSEPKQNNAVLRYRSVLAIDPKNLTARQGLDNIKTHFQVKAFNAIEASDEAAAKLALAKLNYVEPNSEEAQSVAEAIDQFRLRRQRDDFIEQAQTAFTQRKLTLPAKDNALYFYQQALQIDPENETALFGVKSIADEFIQKANDAVLDGEFNRAAAHLATVSIIDPQHNSIALIEAMIKRAQPLVETAQRNSAQQAQTPTSTRQPNRAADSATENESANTSASVAPTLPNTRTPSLQAREQAQFDQQYLLRGLDAYYKGDYQQAATLLQPLADKGIARAQFRLGYMHFLGRGFDRDRQQADEIIRASLPAIQRFAEEGRAWAQSDLGSLYEDGLVLRRDFSKAIYWYRSAANQGYPGAQTNLGIMYALGKGVSSSRRTAVEWFQRAAKQGDIVAQRNLQALGIN